MNQQTHRDMRTIPTTLRKWLLLLAMALVGCAESYQYPCAVVQERNGFLRHCYGDSVTMITPHHAIVYRDGRAMDVKDNENLLHVQCTSYKLLKP